VRGEKAAQLADLGRPIAPVDGQLADHPLIVYVAVQRERTTTGQQARISLGDSLHLRGRADTLIHRDSISKFAIMAWAKAQRARAAG